MRSSRIVLAALLMLSVSCASSRDTAAGVLATMSGRAALVSAVVVAEQIEWSGGIDNCASVAVVVGLGAPALDYTRGAWRGFLQPYGRRFECHPEGSGPNVGFEHTLAYRAA